MTETVNKQGRWTLDDEQFLKENYEKMSYVDIGKILSRNPNTVRQYIEKKLKKTVRIPTRTQLPQGVKDITKGPIWMELKTQFSDSELEMFLLHWNEIVSQFKEDVFHTEEMQIIDMIKLDILMARALRNEKESIGKIDEYKNEIVEEKKLLKKANLDKIAILEEHIAMNKAAYESIHGEYSDLLSKKIAMMKELKGTREQRIKRLDDSKQSFGLWMTELMNNSSLRKELGLYIEKFRVAIDVEEARLFEPHTFADGVVDLPVLSAESLDRLEEKEKLEVEADKKEIKQEKELKREKYEST
jgi:hypothetical protein